MIDGLMFLIGSSMLFLARSLAIFILWIWAIIDVIKSDFKDQTTKIVWIALLIFLPFFGAVIYLLVGKSTNYPLSLVSKVKLVSKIRKVRLVTLSYQDKSARKRFDLKINLNLQGYWLK